MKKFWIVALLFAAGWLSPLTANGELIEYSENVVYDDVKHQYWLKNLNLASDMTYAEQIDLANALNNHPGTPYMGPWGDWHLASEAEMAGLWDNGLEYLGPFFIPSHVQGWAHHRYGRYDHPAGVGQHYYIGGTFDGNQLDDGLVTIGEALAIDDTTVSADISAWITADPATDTDADGIRDDLDQCALTPAGAIVDRFGCVAGDFDKDGDVDSSDLDVLATNFGVIQATQIWYRDADADGYGSADVSIETHMNPGFGWLTVDGDCDDRNASIHPGSEDICDHIDNNCDGQADEACTNWCSDGDGDGYGSDADIPVYSHVSPGVGYVSDCSDCDDTFAQIHPGRSDWPGDGIDLNCDGNDFGDGCLQVNCDSGGTAISWNVCTDDEGTARINCDYDDPECPGSSICQFRTVSYQRNCTFQPCICLLSIPAPICVQ